MTPDDNSQEAPKLELAPNSSSALEAEPLNAKLDAEAVPTTTLSLDDVPNPVEQQSLATITTTPITIATDTITEAPATTSLTDTALEPQESTYHLKWIPWSTEKIPIVMQSINGPCPLIATINVLLFREKIKLPQMLEQITSGQLLTYLGECIVDSVPQDIMNDEHAILNFEQNIHDAIEIMPKLKTGLDVNVKFSSITDFEYTPECIIFDLLRIPLYHGWLVDPSLEDLKSAIGTMSYNQLVDSIICNEATNNPEALAKKLISEEFLATTASQLTEYGLNELRTKIEDNEIGILFRNNHFLTLIKREGHIYTLVTDHGYLTEDNIVWESLDNIEGAGRFFNANFSLSGSSISQKSAFDDEMERKAQVETDYQIALKLKAEEEEALAAESQNRQVVPFQDGNQQQLATPSSSSAHQLDENADFELAKKLQQEECDYWSNVSPNDLPVGQLTLNPSTPAASGCQNIASEREAATFQESEFPPLDNYRGPISGAAPIEIQRSQSATATPIDSSNGSNLRLDPSNASQAMNPSHNMNFPNTSQSQASNSVGRNSQQYHQPAASGTRRSRSERNIKSSNCSLM